MEMQGLARASTGKLRTNLIGCHAPYNSSSVTVGWADKGSNTMRAKPLQIFVTGQEGGRDWNDDTFSVSLVTVARTTEYTKVTALF